MQYTVSNLINPAATADEWVNEEKNKWMNE